MATPYPDPALYPDVSLYPDEISMVEPAPPLEAHAQSLSDLLVEVRDKDLNRLGQIRGEELDLKGTDLFNNVGTWTVRLAPEHPMADILRIPGAGIIVTGPSDVLFSGPVTGPVFETSPANPQGLVTFEGVTDSIILMDYLSIPQPSNPNMATQTLAHDTRTGVAEDLLHAYVNANIGPSAPVERRKVGLTMGTNLSRGAAPITKSPRFQVLGELLSEIASVGRLGFRVVQRGDVLVFETYAITDRTSTVRLDTYNGQLIGQKVAISPPSATRVLVAGQEEGVNRQFVYRDNAVSLAAEAEWGRRIERFLDQRQTDVVAELEGAADEVLAEEGFTAVSMQAVPAETSSMVFGVDWYLGDLVVIIVDGVELQAAVTGMSIAVDSNGLRVGAVAGDPTAFDRSGASAKRTLSLEDRISKIEKNVEISLTPDENKVDTAMWTVSTSGPSGSGTAVGHTWTTY